MGATGAGPADARHLQACPVCAVARYVRGRIGPVRRGLAAWSWFSAATAVVLFAGSMPEQFGRFYVPTLWPARALLEPSARDGFEAATKSLQVGVMDATLLVALAAWCVWRRTGEAAWRWGGLVAAGVVVLAQAVVLVRPVTIELAVVEAGAWLWFGAGLASALAFAGSRK